MNQWRLIDTNVISFYFKGDSRADLYDAHLTNMRQAVSLMTVAELDRWSIAHEWGEARKARLARYLEEFTIVPIDRDLCRVWAQVHADLRKQGRAISHADAWIAASALIQGIPLVTHNPRHFEGVPDLKVISEAPR